MKKQLLGLCGLLLTVSAYATDYVQVTNASQLQAGDQVIIACPEKGVTAGSFETKYLTPVSSSFSADESAIVSLGAGTEVFTLGGTSAGWTLTTASGEVLGATSVKEMVLGSGTTTWTISINTLSQATICSTTESKGRILYNVQDPRFLNYTSNVSDKMLLPTLYKAKESEPVVTYAFEYAGYPYKTTHCGTVEYAEGTTITLSKGTPSIDGKIFAGWLYEGKTYKPGTSFTMPAADVSLVAQWNDATDIRNTTTAEQAHKIIRDNTLYIVVGDRTYDLLGNPVK